MLPTGAQGFTGTRRRTGPARWIFLPVALLLLLVLTPGALSAAEGVTVKPNVPVKKADRQPRNMMTIGSTTVPETTNSRHCLELTMADPRKFWKCMNKLKRLTSTVAPGMPWFNSNDTQLIVSKFVGDKATLTCTVENKGNRDVTWMKITPHPILIFVGDRKFDPDRRYEMDTDLNRTFHLSINRLTRADQGIYACTVNSKPKLSWNVTLKIVAEASVRDFESSPNGRRKGQFTFVFNESDVVEITCIGDGSPSPKLKWIGPTGEQLGDAILRIEGIQRDQAGEYRCESDNGYNEVPAVRVITIKVNYKPQVRVDRGDVDIRKAEGDYVKMQCNVDAYPRATYTWRKDGVIVPGRATDKSLQTLIEINCDVNTSRLIIVKIDQEHYGTYTCQATNLLGSAEANISLNGKPLPPVITSDPVGTRRHVYKLTWVHDHNQQPNSRGTIPVTLYRILYRGWWRQSKDRQKVYSLEDGTLLEEIAYPNSQKVQQYCNLHDLRHNATYDLQLYVVNDWGESDPVNFTFYTALEDEASTPDGEPTGPISLSSSNNEKPDPGSSVWRFRSSAPSMAPSWTTVLTMVLAASGLHCTEVYK